MKWGYPAKCTADIPTQLLTGNTNITSISLNRPFQQGAPNVVWVNDITYVRVGENFNYLCVVIDLFSRKVLSYSVSTSIDTALVTASFKEAYANRNQPQGLMFHGDQGTQYMAYQFRSLLRKYGVTQSFLNQVIHLTMRLQNHFFASIKTIIGHISKWDSKPRTKLSMIFITVCLDKKIPTGIELSEKDCPIYCRHSSW